ncbi:MAG: YkgJ family cysteine cluster protein [Syntrophaceae bacterium]|nr:YkgJ family cysteine cluster protein [Syntrophaceae bacterium]
MNSEDWESICNRCGKCCYEKVDLGGGQIIYTKEPCVHLDTKTNLCKVYETRHIVEPDCIALTENLVRSLNWLPPDCAYLEHVRMQDTIAAVNIAKEKIRKKRNNKGNKRRK